MPWVATATRRPSACPTWWRQGGTSQGEEDGDRHSGLPLREWGEPVAERHRWRSGGRCGRGKTTAAGPARRSNDTASNSMYSGTTVPPSSDSSESSGLLICNALRANAGGQGFFSLIDQIPEQLGTRDQPTTAPGMSFFSKADGCLGTLPAALAARPASGGAITERTPPVLPLRTMGADHRRCPRACR